jgi:hypothetical protein
VNRRGAERCGELGPDGDQRRTHDGEGRWIRGTTTANEAHRDTASLELRGDLRPGAVDDDDLVARSVPRPHDVEGVGRDAAAELEDDARHVVYSALSFT